MVLLGGCCYLILPTSQLYMKMMHCICRLMYLAVELCWCLAGNLHWKPWKCFTQEEMSNLSHFCKDLPWCNVYVCAACAVIYFDILPMPQRLSLSLRLQPHGHTHTKKTKINADLIPPATAGLRGQSVAVLKVTPTPAKSYFLMLAPTFVAVYLHRDVITFMQIQHAAEFS